MGLRNLELQLQALDSLRQHGNTSMALVDDVEGVNSEIGEDRLLKHVLRFEYVYIVYKQIVDYLDIT